MTRDLRPASTLFQRTALWAALSLTLLGSAQALTLSRPVVQSKQGETLKAEIDIADMTAAEQVNFQAALAGPEVYKATKLETPTSHGAALEIQVKLLKRNNGRPYLAITSQQTVTSNFLDVLLDLRWANGRLLRAVSLSMDDGRQSAPSSPTVVGSGSASIKVKRGDTAGDLAARNKSTDVSLDQMLVAMLRSNPDAFVNANVNRLKSGSLLNMPSEQDAKAVSREEARKEIQVQTANFQAYRAELAARAPGGTAPKASRDSTGKLEARVQNKKASAKEDKLTLTKPAQGGVEDKLAQQRQAQEVASRAAEMGRNIAELGKIAAATATVAGSSAALETDLPASAASNAQDWLGQLTHHPLAPVGAGSLIALLVLASLWSRRANRQQGDNIQGLPPLNVKFDLDLPHANDLAPQVAPSMAPSISADEAAPTQAAAEKPVTPQAQPARPTMDIPDISLDLDEPTTPDNPFQVRMDLAQELWQLGQLHTSRALMEEVANEAKGEVQARAKQWLTERG